MSLHAETLKLLRHANKQGFSYEQTKAGHYKVTAPNGDHVTVAASPGSQSALRTTVSKLRKLGYEPNAVPSKLRPRSPQPAQLDYDSATAQPANADEPLDDSTFAVDTITVGLEEVTPELALEWLDRANENRRLRRRKVLQYAADMAAGRWKQTGETLIFSSNGTLLDGQHRLHAIIEAEVTLVFVVTRGVNPQAQQAMDQGIARSASDQLRFAGASGYASIVAAGARLWLSYDAIASRHHIVTNQMIHEAYDDDPEGWERAATNGQRAYSQLRAGSPGAYTAAYYVLANVDAAAAHEFFTNLIELRFTQDNGDPIRALHQAMLRLRGVRGTRSTRVRGGDVAWDTMNYCLRAWQRWRAGQRVQSLVLKSDRSLSPIPRPEELL